MFYERFTNSFCSCFVNEVRYCCGFLNYSNHSSNLTCTGSGLAEPKWRNVCKQSRCCCVCYSCGWRLTFFMKIKFMHLSHFLFGIGDRWTTGEEKSKQMLLSKRIILLSKKFTLRYFLDI